LMYTSCGWFFDEISGLEAVQVIQYAARAIQIVYELTEVDLEEEFLGKLKNAPGNIPDVKDGAEVYQKYVKPAVIDLLRVAAHFAISSMFEDYSENSEIFCYGVYKNQYELITAGRNRLALGQTTMRSKITLEEKQISFAVLHLGDHHFYGGVREWQNGDEYNTMCNEIKSAFDRLDIAEMILLMDKHFGMHSYNLWYLFKDKSREVFDKIMYQTLDSIEISFRNVYKNHYATLQAMKRTGTPLPKALSTAVEYVINNDLQQVFEEPGSIDRDKLQNLLHEVRCWDVELDKSTLSFVGSKRLVALMEQLYNNPDDVKIIDELSDSHRILQQLNIDLDLWKAQNILFALINEKYAVNYDEAKSGNKNSAQWINKINELQEKLEVNIRIDKLTGINLQAAV